MNFESKIPQRTYATTLKEQQKQLQTDELMLRFTASRKQLAADRYRPLYHYVNPEGSLNDPNGLCCWQGRYHLFYQAYPPQDPRQHWGHAVSEDLVHWQDLPLAIFPGIEECCFSGSTLVEKDRVIACYHGTKAGTMIAVSSDPLLLNWEKIPGNPVIPLTEVKEELGLPYRVYDPCIWREPEGYYSLSGTYWKGKIFGSCHMVQQLFFSQDLRRWTYLGPFVEGDGFTQPGEDGAVPYFWPIGDRHILVFCSHARGAQYLLGDYDALHHRFHPSTHGRFNFGPIGGGAVHAPSATPDGNGGVHVIFNINAGRPTSGWNQIMSLARRLTLREDTTLGIEPAAAVESLREDPVLIGETPLPANRETVLEGVAGSSMELAAEIEPGSAREIRLCVLRSPQGEEQTGISFYRLAHLSTRIQGRSYTTRIQGRSYIQDALAIDTSRSSLSSDVAARMPEVAPFTLPEGERLSLRVFVDRSVVEVFANDRQCVALRVYPEREDSIGVSLRAQGGDAKLVSLRAWRMKSIWPAT